MNKRKKSIVAFCCLLGFWVFTLNGGLCHAQTDSLPPIWNNYAKKAAPSGKTERLHNAWELYVKRLPLPGLAPYPGRTVGDDGALSAFMKRSAWRYRAASYEMYFASSPVLARSIYGLAIQSGDVDRTMPLERFEKGVRGFHYSATQVCAWINAVLAEQTPIYTAEERRLILWLLKDGVVNILEGVAVPGASLHHVLGAAPGKKRTFEAALRHERLHVLWDEDPGFAAASRAQWAALSEPEKQAARKRLAAYAQSNEAQLIEEWAAAQAESMPENQRKNLVGL